MPTLIQQPEFNTIGIRLSVTANQEKFIKAIRSNTVVIGHGVSGSGKTYTALAEGFRQLLDEKQKIESLILVRPAVEAEENLGFLPGELHQKIEPYMTPFLMNARKMLNGNFERISKSIRTMTMAYLRGMTFENCYVILDEAQNTTIKQMKLFLSRIGKHCKVVVIGDTDQSDITNPNGLTDALKRFANIKGLAICSFSYEDNMRSYIVDKILRAYDGITHSEAQEQFNDFIDDTFGDSDNIPPLELPLESQNEPIYEEEIPIRIKKRKTKNIINSKENDNAI